MASSLRHINGLSPLFSLYEWLMNKTGLFAVKAKWKSNRYFRKAAMEDEKRRRIVADKIMALPDSILSYNARDCNVVVSMTSYGKRVATSAPYAIYTIFTQQVLPNRIVLNIDETKWNDDNIPYLLKILKQKGLEIRYVKDLGPHTKLIPSLNNYPDDVIITLDDDVYYTPNTLAELIKAYQQSDKRTVLCREGRVYPFEKQKCKLYSQLPSIRTFSGVERVLPFGVAGVLYPPHIFSDEVFNEAVFLRLCPKADDIWFSIMEWRDGVKTAYIGQNSWTGNQDVDRNEEYNTDVSNALYQTNDVHGKNDEQYKDLVEYYGLLKQ